MQLEFSCRGCGARGLTPDVGREQALGLAGGRLRLRCPRCGWIIAIESTPLEVAGNAAGPRRRLSEVVRQALGRMWVGPQG